jgi:hypothetical protein
MSDFRFILDKMSVAGFAMPSYVGYDKKTASAEGREPASYENRSFPIDSQENVWLSAVKLACDKTMPAWERDIYSKRVYDAAEHYGIRADLDKAAEFIVKSETEPHTVRTENDWQKAQSWLIKNAGYLDPRITIKLANYLLDTAGRVGRVLSLLDQFDLREMAGRNPMTPELQKFAEQNLHRLANGTYYRTDQFASLTYDEVNEIMPDLVKTASLGMPVLQPDAFAKAASEADEAHANILEHLLTQHGQYPVHSERGLPVEINDRILAEL